MSLIPLFSILALVGLIAVLVWLVARSDADEARAKLATDALWVEQTLRFQLSVDEDMLVRLALDGAGGVDPELLVARARQHVASNPEVLSIGWYDGEGNLLRAVPGQDRPLAARQEMAELFARARGGSARPVYGTLDPDAATRISFGLRTADGRGLIAATVSLGLMLDRHIPWWIAEKNAVELVDAGGAVLVARARVAPEPGAKSHTISFDPPLRGALLRITPYVAASNLGNTLLLAAIGALSVFAVLALLVLSLSAARRRRAEQQLRSEMAFRRSMEESLTVGLRARDHEGRILYVNPAFCSMVGHPETELVGQLPPMPYWLPDRVADTMARHQALAKGGARPQSFEARFRHRDGHEIEVQVFEAPLIDATGAHQGWMGSVIDITDAKEAQRMAREQEENLARTGRLVTLGEMASTLAHELNQPLSAIAGYAAGAMNLLASGKADAAVLTPALEKLAHQANRAGKIIRRIQDFVRKREPRFTEVSLAEIVADTAAFLAADAREHRVQLVTEIAEVPACNADRILLEQVLINLIRNGFEAMAERRSGDLLTVSLCPGEGGMELCVADQGAGIDPALADRLFDAFASTKTDGMGMGLNICRSIVELHHGQLGYRANPGGGTVFIVTLPAAARTAEAAE